MSVVATAKWIVKNDKVKRTEKLVSTVIVAGFNYLVKQAAERGEFHEANHNIMALMAGNSIHEQGHSCAVPTDRMLNQEEAIALASSFTVEKEIEAPSRATGFYL